MNYIDSLPKTEAAINRAFLDLIREMPLSAIRVKDLTERSGIGRTTFYLHYKDREDLLDKLEDGLIRGFMRQIQSVREEGVDKLQEGVKEGLNPGFVSYFVYLRANREEFAALLGSPARAGLLKRWQDAIWELDLNIYNAGSKPIDPVSRHRYRSLLIPTYVNLFVDWIDGGMAMSDEAMAHIVTAFWRAYVFTDQPIYPDEIVEHRPPGQRTQVKPADKVDEGVEEPE